MKIELSKIVQNSEKSQVFSEKSVSPTRLSPS